MTPVDPIRDLGPTDKLFLLRLARDTIADKLGLTRNLPHDAPSQRLEEKGGAFVTLTLDGKLRGCIGHIVAIEPLWKAVRENARSAAFRDPRFPPLTHEEFDLIRIEISALTPLERIEPRQVEIGRHGLLIECGGRRGVLLPQVAVAYGWDREEFLDHTCQKAGLDPGCWRRPDTIISAFSAEVFGEE